MTYFAFSALINTFTSLTLGGVVLLHKESDERRITFALFALSVALWSMAYFLWQIAIDARSALIWVRLLMTAASFIPFVYFHFVTAFLQKTKKYKMYIVVGYLIAGILAYFSLTSNFIIASISQKLIFPFWPTAGILLGPFLCVWFSSFILATVLLLQQYRVASPVEKNDIIYITVGMLLGFAGGSTNFFLWFDIPILPYANILVSLYVVAVAYAMMRTHLFNIRLFSAELFTVFIWLFALVRIGIASTPRAQMEELIFLIGAVIIGILLLRSVSHEIDIREKVEKMAVYLTRANARLRELDRQKTEFVSIASHELRSPISSIRGYASMLLEGSYGAVPEYLREPLSRIQESGRLTALAVDDFLNVTRIEQGKMRYDRQLIDLCALVTATIRDLSLMASEHHISLTSMYDQERVFVYGDEGKLKQILINIIENAIKYTPQGMITVHILFSPDHEKVWVSVIDTGIGLSKKDQDQLFQKFFRASNANTVSVHGTGLGLYLVNEMVKAHSGRVWVESAGQGKGSTFYIELPLARNVPQQA